MWILEITRGATKEKATFEILWWTIEEQANG
jgi:hypothetical protein